MMEFKLPVESGAIFKQNRRYRICLWRIWDRSKPLVLFIGLNPSTADESENNPTIRSVINIATYNGYGGVYMMNCWPFVSTDPDAINIHGFKEFNDDWWFEYLKNRCKDVVFAWGNFKIVEQTGRGDELRKIFPTAKCIGRNKNGSPKHPLYQRKDSKLIKYIP